ncbi:DNA-directed RNA polymerases I [Papiliotrema laurentii]|uniref:DNA-directed RNA polymerases I n=1 Tax=Papiliotrema laurentii TaxID=5418 RepID=A0AAD9L7Z3_PAPLA|nr:DNA-directed RNA polymerases I [Papiliotrema laurentii]
MSAPNRYTQQNPNSMPDRPNGTESNKQVAYLCGDCGVSSVLSLNDPVRCKECGHRVMYKPRTHRIVQFEAR